MSILEVHCYNLPIMLPSMLVNQLQGVGAERGTEGMGAEEAGGVGRQWGDGGRRKAEGDGRDGAEEAGGGGRRWGVGGRRKAEGDGRCGGGGGVEGGGQMRTRLVIFHACNH